MKKSFFVLLASVAVLTGCATGKNYENDINAMNARISALQSQLAEKDQEVARLKGQMDGQSSALSMAEADKRALNEKLDQLQAEMRAAKSKPAPKAPAYDSDLK